jgi:hypothetical protein
MDDVTRVAIDEVQIRALLAAYSDVVNRRAWPELDSLFAADATITLDVRAGPTRELAGAGALHEFLDEALRRFAFFMIVTLNTRVVRSPEGHADVASARTYICEIRQDHDGEHTRAFGLYQDTFRRTGEEWRFARRRYQSIARGPASGTLDVLPPPEIFLSP